jgi:hypothetical protein
MKLIALLLFIAFSFSGFAVLAQTQQDSLLQQMAEQSIPLANGYDNQLLDGTNEPGVDNETYLGIKNFWNKDIVGNFFANIGQVTGRWLAEWINGWLAETVRFLTTYLRTFVLNPDLLTGLSQNQSAAAGQTDDISPFIQQSTNVIYAIALNILLILFILSVWRYWTEAAWHAGVSVFGAVGRLIFTISIILAWRSLYAMEIKISNEMIQALYFQSADQIQVLDVGMGNLVKSGLAANSGLVAQSLGNVSDPNAVNSVGGAIGGLVSIVGLVIFLVFALVLIAQLLIILILKALQTALLAVQYMFAPFFLVFFATPDTSSIASGYIKSFIEVSLWTFLWVGLLKIMTILLFASMSPWGKILLSIGVMQLMIQAPGFLARAKLSPLSSVVSAGLMSKNAVGQALSLGQTMVNKAGSIISGSKHEAGNSVAMGGFSPPKLAWRADANDNGSSLSLLKTIGLPRPIERSGTGRSVTKAGGKTLRVPSLDGATGGQQFIPRAQSLGLPYEPNLSGVGYGSEKAFAALAKMNEPGEPGPVTNRIGELSRIEDHSGEEAGLTGSLDAKPWAEPGIFEADTALSPYAFDPPALLPRPEEHIESELLSVGDMPESDSTQMRGYFPAVADPNSHMENESWSERHRLPGLNNLATGSLKGAALVLGRSLNPIAVSRCLNPDPTTNVHVPARSDQFSLSINSSYSDSSTNLDASEIDESYPSSLENVRRIRSGSADLNAGNAISLASQGRRTGSDSFAKTGEQTRVPGFIFDGNSDVRFSSVFLTGAGSIVGQASSGIEHGGSPAQSALVDLDEPPLTAIDPNPRSALQRAEVQSDAPANRIKTTVNSLPSEILPVGSGLQNRTYCRSNQLAMGYILNDLKSAGFQDCHLQNPHIVDTMLDLYEDNPTLLYGGADPRILQSAAFAANSLPPSAFTREKALHFYKEVERLT